MHEVVKYYINIIVSRIPAARPAGSMFAVPGFRRLCVRKLLSRAEEDDEETNGKTKSKNMMKKKAEEEDNNIGKETKMNNSNRKVATRDR